MSAGRSRRAAGWYQDPDDPTRVRHWSGRGWTSRRRPRPSWHVLPVDLAAERSWSNPGGVDRPTSAQPLGLDHPAFDGPIADGPTADGPARDSSTFDGTAFDSTAFDGTAFGDPALGDPAYGPPALEGPALDQPLAGSPRDGPRHGERPTRDQGFRSEPFHADTHRFASSSGWAAAAAFGSPPADWAPRLRGPGSGPGRAGSVPHRTRSGAPGSVTDPRWRRRRVPALVVVGVTLFAVLVLSINLGTGARGHFSAVSVDTAFVVPANVACATALGARKTVTGTGTPHPAADSGRGGRSSEPLSTATPSSAELAVLATVANTLRRLRTTPAAAPQVDVWLDDWERFLAEERELSLTPTDRTAVQLAAVAAAAHRDAADADLFAADHGLTSCTLAPTSVPGLETIP